jgi:chlorite dismutase
MSDAPPDELPVGYALWAVFREGSREAAVASESLVGAERELRSTGVSVRGVYDVSGLRADADRMVWLTGPDLAGLQAAIKRVRNTFELNRLVPTWNAAGVHREAEFSRAHAPAFLRGLPPKEWVTVYPFVRSYDWYLLPEDERRAMLADHGRKGSEYAGVQANTVAAFALGDYEWILALEADDPIELVDVMRHLRKTEARRHVREETPFFTGRRLELDAVPW